MKALRIEMSAKVTTTAACEGAITPCPGPPRSAHSQILQIYNSRNLNNTQKMRLSPHYPSMLPSGRK
jgi:hypothetical protein